MKFLNLLLGKAAPVRVSHYEYFLLGDTVPVRVSYNDKGQKFSAEVPLRDKRDLIIKTTYLSRLEHSFEVDEIDKVAFERLCRKFWDERGIAR